MTPRLALIAALALGAGCIDKPGPPSEDADGGPGGDGDGGVTGDGGPCDGLVIGEPQEWLDTDEIRFDRAQGRVNGDCLEDLVIPGARQDDGPGVFVVLGRSENMLTGGFDSFVDTDERIAADVRLVDLVGTQALDLVVLAQNGDGDGSATILVYPGDGQGGFDALFADNNADDVALEIGDPTFVGALFVDTLQLEEGGEVSLVYGDTNDVRLLSPSDWDDDMAVSTATPIPPAGVAIDGNGLTDVFPVPSGTAGVDDFVLLDFDQLEWYARQTADAYVPEPMASAEPGIGRADFGRIDGDTVPDVIYSRAQGVWADVLTKPGAPTEPGSSTQLPFIPEPAFDAAINQWSDLQLAQLDDDERRDLVLLGIDADGDTQLYVYANLGESNGDLVNEAGNDDLDLAPQVSGLPWDRVVTGTFSQDGVVDIYLLTRHPGEVGALCFRAEVDQAAVAVGQCP